MKTDFISIEKILGNADIDFSASFTHGLLTAFSCKGFNNVSWASTLVSELDPDDSLQKESLNKLKTVQEITESSLSNEDLDFQLVLDDANGNLEEEALSTREWANGFWLGIQQTHLVEVITQEEDMEFFDDLQKISAMPIPEETTSDTQNDLFEIQEYLRVGVIGLYLSSWQS